MTTSLNDALLDVRKAYRLLADYQQRMIELLAFMRTELGATQYHHYYRHSVPRDFNGLEGSHDAGSRFLPFLDMSVLWLRNNGQEDAIHIHQRGDLLIDVVVGSDTGNSPEWGCEPDSVESVEESSSSLAVYFFVCDKPARGPLNWYYRVWSAMDYPEEFGEVAASKNLPGDYRVYGEELRLIDLADEKSVRAAISALRQTVSAKLRINI